MNNTAYAAGLACGILIAVVILLIFHKFNKNKLKGTFDERQELAKGRGYKYSTFTLLILIVIDLLAESFGVFEILPFTRELVLFFILIVGVLVFAVYCIMNDAYLGVGTNMRSYKALMWIIIVLNGVSAIMGFRDGAMVDGKLVFGPFMSLLCCLAFVIIGVAFYIKGRSAAAEENEEDI